MSTAIWIVLLACAVGGLTYAFRPVPALVDMATIETGELQITVDEDGKTRIKERYVVSTPLGGRVMRIELRAGDVVTAGETLLASIEPRAADMLDARTRQQAEAQVRASEAALKRAGPAHKKALAETDFATSEVERIRQLAQQNAAPQKELQRAEMMLRISKESTRSARFDEEIARYELEMAQAALARTDDSNEDPDARFEIHAPINGRVLRVFQESAAPADPGTPLLSIGDPRDLEVEVDVLSADAVRVKPGDDVVFDRWGGAGTLRGVVRLVEPQAFTKTSALGIEEQRVNVIADFLDSSEDRGALGDAYRVQARIVVWREPSVVKVPTSALFRDGDEWAVFAVVASRSQLRQVRLGEQNDLEAQVLDGLQAGEIVIVHPSDKIADNVVVQPR
ncbi:MAG: HlyD family efflux transporter periplasmic adaptor subunit [Pirellulaceae bacterium]|nr:HlyD family efflux transporter periplasmic adaptor subunit [Pirellulaceae bacterium]MDP7017262.1 HlyD family efflux transporter periplasmic adaptor subunit [Pirellulaceae bacterium]